MQHRLLSVLLVLLPLTVSFVQAQVPVTGLVLDSLRKPVVAARITLIRSNDSLVTGAITDSTGRFRVDNVLAGTWRLRVSAPGYKQHFQLVPVSTQPVRVPTITIRELVLNEVDIVDQVPMAQQKGDTTEFNAQAFKVNRDASAEDLVRKMPGITMQNGQVQSNGENVQRVLVDGKPMFDNDPSAALRNLPAEAVDRVQVYDDVSDQARFSGLNDGQTRRTINIVTRPDRRKAEFGRVYGGYGTDDRYQGGGVLNRFRGGNRLTLLAQSNNTNQQNFSFEDIFSGFGGGSGGGLRGGGGGQVIRMGGAPGGGGGSPMIIGGGGGGGQFGNVGNLFIGSANGIVRTNAIGLNLTHDFSSKLKFTGSYFLNQREFDNTQNTNRIFATERAQTYDEVSVSDNTSLTHRWNGRLEWNPDTINQVLITTRGTYQDGDATNGYVGNTRFTDTLASRVSNQFGTDNSGITFNLEALYRHRFAKAGRTITLGGSIDLNDREEERLTESLNQNFVPFPSSQPLRQRANTTQDNWTYSGNLSYTEALSKLSQAEITYSATLRDNESDARTFDRLGSDTLVTALSNVFESGSLNQQAGVGYRLNHPKHQITARLLYNWTTLDNDRTFPTRNNFQQTFTNLLPSVTYAYIIDRTSSLRINYRASANLPQVSQLQDVLDVSNPQRPSAGNPNLRQEFQHFIFARWNKADPARSRFRALNVFATYTEDYIASVTDILREPTTRNGVLLPAGAQFTAPQNLGAAYNVRAFGILSTPIKFIKSNFSGTLQATWSQTPGRVNGVDNQAQNALLNGGLNLSSNISENIDFTIGSNTAYNVVRNSAQGQNDNYWNQSSSIRLDWRFGRNKGWLFQTDATNQVVTGLSEGYNTTFTLWNVAIGHKLFKRQNGEIKLYAFDILKQNNNLSRNVTSTYFEDVRNTVVTQYFMVIFTYNFRKFHS